MPLWRAGRRRDFNPRTPRGVRRFFCCPRFSQRLISIHAPREGCDRRSGRRFPCRRNFNPRTPRGVRHRAIGAWQAELEFQSTHPARGATPSKIGDRGHNRISIHAPREGCDAQLRPQSEGHIVISIHAPREGCDLDTSRGCTQGGISIHAPREGCDRERARSVGGGGDFNPRTPRGVRPQDGAQRFPVIIISIHAPREGCDSSPVSPCHATPRFQSTHPARGATVNSPVWMPSGTNFNPRTPRGVRRRGGWQTPFHQHISIHAPREGCDTDFRAVRVQKFQFQSTHPARGATLSNPA